MITRYTTDAQEIMVLPVIDFKPSSLSVTWGGDLSFFDYVDAWSFSVDDGDTWSEFDTASNIILLLQSNTSTKYQFKVALKASIKDELYHVLKLNAINIDSVSYPVVCVELLNSDSMFRNVLNVENVWRPQDELDDVFRMREIWNKALSDMMGLRVQYFHCSLDESGNSHTFRTFTLPKVTDYDDILIIADDKNTPTNEVEFDEYYAYFKTYEVYVDKTEWFEHFEKPPTTHDFIFFERFNKMMSVSSVIDERNFSNHSVCWKLSLVKYSDDGSVDKTLVDGMIDDFGMFIDGAGLHQSEKELDEYKEAGVGDSLEETLLSAETEQHNMHSRLYYRQEGILATRSQVSHLGVLGNDWMYKVPETPSDELLLGYNLPSDTDKFSLSFWFKISDTTKVDDIFEIQSEFTNQLLTCRYDDGFELRMNSNSGQTVMNVPANGALDVETTYFMFINRNKAMITFNVGYYDVDTGSLVNVLQSNATNWPVGNPPNKLLIKAAANIGLCIGNIRMNNTIHQTSEHLDRLFETDNKFYLFDQSKIVFKTGSSSDVGEQRDGQERDPDEDC